MLWLARRGWFRVPRSVGLLLVLLCLLLCGPAVATVMLMRQPTRIDVGDKCRLIGFSPNGRLLASIDAAERQDGLDPTMDRNLAIHLWNVADGTRAWSLYTRWSEIEAVHFSPNSRFLAASHRDGRFKLWETESGQEVVTIPPITKRWLFSPDSRFLVSYRSDEIILWNLETRQLARTINQTAHLEQLTFSADGTRMLTCYREEGGQSIRLWKVDPDPPFFAPLAEYRIECELAAHSADFTTVVCTKPLADQPSTEVVVHDLASSTRRASFTISRRINLLTLTPDGKTLIALHPDDGPAPYTMWDISGLPQQVGMLWGKPFLSPSGKWLAVDNTGALVMLGEVRPFRYVSKLREWGTASTVTFSPAEDTVLLGGQQVVQRDGGIKAEPHVLLSEVPSGRPIRNFFSCVDARVSPDSRIVAALIKEVHPSTRSAIEIWDLRGKPVGKILAITLCLWLAILSPAWFILWRRRRAPGASELLSA